jgi:hypothetical protein
MRRTPFLLVALALLPLAACGGRRIADPGPGQERASAFVVPPSTKKVAGKDIEAVEDGAWVVRRTARPPARKDRRVVRGGGGDDAGEVHEDVEYESSMDAPMAGGASEAPPGMREPSDPTPTTPTTTPSPSVNTPQPGLKAGSTDDNVDFDAFLEFLGTWVDQVGVADRYQHLDVTDRRFLRVVDGRGHPVPGARVHVVDETADRVVWSGRTYGDGRVPFYPLIVAESGAVPEGGWLVDVRHGDVGSIERWDGQGTEHVVHLDAAKPVEEPVQLDVCILLDTTGSMRDEMARIKATLVEVTQRLRALGTEFDLRIGAVLYRDLGDPYVTMTHPFTGDVVAFAEALQGLDANGGGDEPESLNQGMAEAVGTLDWRQGAAHILFVIADAPPHMDYEGDVPYGTSLLAALDQGIRVHAVAASGLNPFGTFVFRQIAQFGRGKFIFIEYGSPAKSAASHGVTGAVKSNNLDDILYEQITAELAGWGRPPAAASDQAPETSR